MVDGSDFANVVIDAIGGIASYSSHFGEDVPILDLISPLGFRRASSDYRKLSGISREEIREKLLTENFMTAIRKLSEEGPITIYDSSMWFQTSLGQKIQGNVLTDDSRYFCKPDDLIGLKEELDRLYWELKDQNFTLTPLDGPDGDVVTFVDEVDEAVGMVLKIINDTFIDDLAKISTFRGRTVQSHLMAEDWGADKDAIFSTVCIRETVFDTRKNAKTLVKSWLGCDVDDFSIKQYLKWMKPAKGGYMDISDYWATGWMPRLPKYWKASLVTLAKKLECGLWYDARELWTIFITHTAQLHFTGLGTLWAEHFAKFAAEPPVFLVDTGKDKRGPLVVFKRMLIDRAIFFGMLYTLAIFGVFDITEKEPEMVLMRTKTKKGPFSPFDCISRIRLTEYGRWVLGLRDDKPEIQTTFSEPVLDKDLLIITYKGRSVTIRSFLGEIGKPLGDIRWKVTQESFLDGCEDFDLVEERIETMRKFFSPIPANWERFFDRVVNSFGLTPAQSTGHLLDIRDKRLVEELLEEPTIRKHVLLVEGGKLFLFDSGVKSFTAALSRRGYKVPFIDHEEDKAKWRKKRGK